ncbi:hypothetical protein C3B72_01970 [Clostridium tetani]|nr:hypothetical protein C3B72_01970 [Clostridium tetani]RXI77680.1 hypothetical protein DP128_02215 [Clostridium tetani]RXM57437.1 hypothetical protein DP133_10035 [Clostridium tetani]
MLGDVVMKYLFVDGRISIEEEYNLMSLEYNIIKCPIFSLLYYAISGHPDILIHVLDEKNLILHKDIDKEFIKKLKNLNFNIKLSKNSLSSSYPMNIGLNAVNLSNVFIHNLKYTDPVLIENVKDKNLINVKQGYTKCSVAVVSDNAIITSDKIIAQKAKEVSIDVLLIPPGDIILPGLDYGFIGGCCGLIEKDLMAFFGDLNYFNYGNEIKEFLYKHNVKPIYLRKGKLIDRGSILCNE